MKINAHAKVNLILNVVGTRADGYHELETVMQALPLHDIVTVEQSDKPSVFEFGDKDLTYKALTAMQKSFGIEGPVHIEVEKHIPVAAGLGGGSSDCAAVIYGLCRLYNINIDEKVFALAAGLGADVPFCLGMQTGHKAALCTGIGDKLQYIDYTPLDIELEFSDFNLPNKTAAVYKEFCYDDRWPYYDVNAFIKSTDPAEKIKYLGNQLQPALERLTGIKKDAVLCGAGPTYFKAKVHCD